MSASGVMEGWHNPEIAELYQRAEAASGPFARAVIKQSGLPDYPSSAGPLVVFDNACGAGAVTAQLYDIVGSDKGMRVTCGDTAEGMIRYVEKRIERDGWTGAEAKIIDAVYFPHVFSTFGLGHVSEPHAAVAECYRILKPSGGTIGLVFWNKLSWHPLAARALATLPGQPPFPTEAEFLAAIHKGEWYDPTYTSTQLLAAGFEDVNVEVVARKQKCGTPKQFAKMLYMPLVHIAQTFWNEEQRERCQGLIVGAMEKALTEIYGEDSGIEIESDGVVATGRKIEK